MDNEVQQAPASSTPPSKKSNNTPLMLIIFAIILIGAVGFFVMNKKNNQAAPTNTVPTEAMKVESTSPTSMQPSEAMKQETATSPASAKNVKEFTVTGSNFKFEPSTLTVNKGDTVKITFKNVGGMHDFKIDELNVATKRIATDQEDSVQFVADKTGTFTYYCSVGQHRQMGMQGTLTIQ